ncbi:MAG: ABC transporter ATP-binding protein [Dermatophilus congolensis]|nr:ABC transporter ATP-binding protein [Dermatophilus congolensis]
MAELLSVQNLRVVYPGHPPLVAVNDVSLTIEAGETVALVGESGCGKSTLARAVAGMEAIAGGEVHFRGKAVPKLGFRRRTPEFTAIQMVFQDPNSSLNPRRTVRSQIFDGIRAAKARGDEGSEPAEWLERVGLGAGAASGYTHEFSGGQRQRIAIARALASRPNLLIADEPISALDASTQAAVAELMRSLCRSQNAGMLFISHDLSVVRLIADRLFVMYRGQVVESGDTETIWNDPLHPYTKALLGAIPQPDGSGTLPAAPAQEAPPEWSMRMPEAMGRTAGVAS